MREIERLERQLQFSGRHHRLLALVDSVVWGIAGALSLALPLWGLSYGTWKTSAWPSILLGAAFFASIAYPEVAARPRRKIGQMRTEIKRLHAGHRGLVRRYRGSKRRL